MFKEDIFVDTSAWIALVDKNDSNHKKACSIYLSMLKDQYKIVTSNLVISETYILTLNELGYTLAIDFIENTKASPRIHIIYSCEEIEKEALRILKKYQDQNFSYTDSVSFAIMKDKKINKAFAFDKHFRIAGFLIIQFLSSK